MPGALRHAASVSSNNSRRQSLTSIPAVVYHRVLRLVVPLTLSLLLVPLCAGAQGLFKLGNTYDTLGETAFSVAVGDLNGDGKADMVVSNYCVQYPDCSHATVAVLLGNGDGTFQPAQTYNSGGSYAVSVALADVNHDNKLDLLIADMCSDINCVDSVAAVLLGNGDGTFQSAQTYDVGMVGAESIAVADVNGDSKPDLLIAADCLLHCSGGVVLFAGNGDGTFQAAQTLSAGAYPKSVQIGDLNADGEPDLAVADECRTTSDCSSGSLAVLIGNGNGTFLTPQMYGSGAADAVSVALGDVNGDGKSDLLVANGCVSNNCTKGSPGVLGVLLGHGDGTFANVVTYNSGGQGANFVTVADVSRDGIPDLLAVNFCFTNTNCGQGGVAVLRGKGDGTFEPAQTYKTGGHTARSIALADVSGDSRLDLLVTNACPSGRGCPGGVVGVLLGTARYATATTVTSSLNPAIYGQTVTLSATVESAGGSVPTGKVVFKNGSKSLGSAKLIGGIAKISKSTLPAGTLSIVANYAGDDESENSQSTALSQVITQATSATTISSSQNPSAQGQAVTFTAVVTSPTAKVKGTVTFTAGSTTLGTVQLAGGKAKITTSSLPKGSTNVTATYNGTANIIGSAASLTQVVN